MAAPDDEGSWDVMTLLVEGVETVVIEPVGTGAMAGLVVMVVGAVAARLGCRLRFDDDAAPPPPPPPPPPSSLHFLAAGGVSGESWRGDTGGDKRITTRGSGMNVYHYYKKNQTNKKTKQLSNYMCNSLIHVRVQNRSESVGHFVMFCRVYLNLSCLIFWLVV